MNLKTESIYIFLKALIKKFKCNIVITQGVTKVKVIPDGNATFTAGMGMVTTFKNRGFGQRSWRYSAVIDNKIVEKMWVEPNMTEDSDPDPFEVSNAETMLEYLKS